MMDSRIEQLHERASTLANTVEEGNGTTDSIDQAIVLDRQALDICPPDHPLRSSSLTLLANHLGIRYKMLGKMAELEEAIVLDQEALQLRPPGHQYRSTPLLSLANHLFIRYHQLGQMKDLDEAIELNREGLSLCPPGHPSRAIFLNNHAADLATRHKQFGPMENLDAAIALIREALELIPLADTHHRSGSLHNLALYLSTRYDQLGGVSDLDEAILLSQEALALVQPGHYSRCAYLSSLSNLISTRYLLLGAREDIEEAITLARTAVELQPPGHPDRSALLGILASQLSERYTRFGAIADLDEATSLHQNALLLRPPGHPARSTSFICLASCLFSRYLHRGLIEDLSHAIALNRDALVLRPPGHLQRPSCLSDLAEYLASRYQQLGAIEDLEEAMVLDQEALELRPPGHPERARTLLNLTARLTVRYQKLKEVTDLNQAIILGRDAVALHPPGDTDRAIALCNLASNLVDRYKCHQALEDLDEALALDREALVLRPPGHPLRWIALHNLSTHLFDRHEQLGSTADLNETIVLLREALALRERDHTQRAVSLGVLASRLCTRFTQSNEPKDREEMFGLWAELAHVPQTVSLYEVAITQEWINAAELCQHPTTILAYETSLRYLFQHLSTVPSLRHQLEVLQNLTSTLGVDAFSACLRNESPLKAVELLEQGRGIFWGQLSRLRLPLDDVIASGSAGKELADQFKELTSEISHTLSPEGDQRDRAFHVNTELQRVVRNIRELPGLSSFLLPPLYSNLQQAAKGGPVIVVNSSKYGCDALVMLLDRDPVHISLKISQKGVGDLARDYQYCTIHSQSANMTKLLASVLRKLWEHVVFPIVDFLRTICPYQSRIWWSPTSDFCILPLHAAGPYRKGQQNLPDLYISSYTTTLSALIHARRPGPSNSHPGKQFLAVGNTTAFGPGERSAVPVELDNILERLDSHTTWTRLDGDACRVSKVTHRLKQCDWVHFACLARPRQDKPFKSALFLHSGPLSIYRLLQCEMEHPELAYLSVSYGTIGPVDLEDEGIHLVSAMLFAGFRSVIGTKWAVDDGEATRVASEVYAHMVDEAGHLDYTRAAFALNETMKTLVDLPLDQRVLFVHFGA